MHVEELLRRYAEARDIERGTLNWLSLIVARYSRHLGRAAVLDDFSDENVNAWASAMIESGELARRTIHSYRRGLLILWRYSDETGLVANRPGRLRKIKTPKLIPTAWSAEQVGVLLQTAMALDGFYRCGVNRATFWAAVILAIWDTGLRIGDLLRIGREHVGEDGVGCLVQKKTGWPLMFRLSPPAAEMVLRIRHDSRERIFGDVVSRKTAFATFRQIARAAGLSGGTKKIRKSGATAVEAASPGAAMAYLGHKTPGLAYQYYVDPRLIQQTRPTPPPLELPAADPDDPAKRLPPLAG